MIKKVFFATILNTLWLIFWYDNRNDQDQAEQIEKMDHLISNPKLGALLWSFLERIIIRLPKYTPCSTEWSHQVIINVGALHNVQHLQSIISNQNNYSLSDLQVLEGFLNQLIVSTKSYYIPDTTWYQNVGFPNAQTQIKLIIAIDIVILVLYLVLLRKSGFKNKKLNFAILASLSSTIVLIICDHLQDVQFMLINFSWEIGLSFCLIIIILATFISIYNLKFRDKPNTTTETFETDEDVMVVKENSLNPLLSSNDLHSKDPVTSANNDLDNLEEYPDQTDFVFEPPILFPPIDEFPIFQGRKRNASEQSSSSSISRLSTFSQYSTLSKRGAMFPSCLSRKFPTFSNDNSFYPSCSAPLSTSRVSEMSLDTDVD